MYQNIKKLIATLSLAIMELVPLYAATAYYGCPNFANLNGDFVAPYASEFTYTVTEGRHTLIEKQGTDPRTGNQLNILPSGETWSIKLGNENVGSENESLTYHFLPDETFPYLLVNFAVVMQNPRHSTEQQPFFSVSVTDTNGKPLTPNSSYEVYAEEGLEGFSAYDNNFCQVLWRDWSSIMVDLTHFMGQEVLVSFKTRDCLQSGHFGYAYFNASCQTNEIELLNCNADGSVSLSMPAGFTSYKWSDGSTNQTFEGFIGEKGLWCDATSVLGTVSRTYVALPDSKCKKTTTTKTCLGEYYQWHGFQS